MGFLMFMPFASANLKAKMKENIYWNFYLISFIYTEKIWLAFLIFFFYSSIYLFIYLFYNYPYSVIFVEPNVFDCPILINDLSRKKSKRAVNNNILFIYCPVTSTQSCIIHSINVELVLIQMSLLVIFLSHLLIMGTTFTFTYCLKYFWGCSWCNG